ncbi:hypothetical protein ACV35T_31910, partial [Pseudomonas aeruginosa]
RARTAPTRPRSVVASAPHHGRRALFQVFRMGRIKSLLVDRRPARELWEALQQARLEVHDAPLRTPPAGLPSRAAPEAGRGCAGGCPSINLLTVSFSVATLKQQISHKILCENSVLRSKRKLIPKKTGRNDY